MSRRKRGPGSTMLKRRLMSSPLASQRMLKDKVKPVVGLLVMVTADQKFDRQFIVANEASESIRARSPQRNR